MFTTIPLHARLPILVLAAAAAWPAVAAETVKIGFIDVLSGPFAKSGEGSLAQLREVVLQLNASAGPKDPRFEVVPFDGKGAPQESVTVLKAATDQGIRYITQGGGSGVAFALSEAVTVTRQQVETAHQQTSCDQHRLTAVNAGVTAVRGEIAALAERIGRFRVARRRS